MIPTTATLDENRTAQAPSFPDLLSTCPHPPHGQATIDSAAVGVDFEILRLLGRGAAGPVYLARQRSLDRLVALKVTCPVGREACALARLEHPHIVQVYSEAVSAAGDARLLCLQYVPGATLADLLAAMRRVPRGKLSGAVLLEALDALAGGQPTAIDAQGLRDRALLAASSNEQAACWIVARLAEALDFAHRRGVLHRDIKPANVLIDPYGRPLLADFGLSPSQAGAEHEPFGGTPAYMAPEHLEAFCRVAGAAPALVDERSDLYGLGMVLYELLALRLPELLPKDKSSDARWMAALATARRAAPAALHTELPQVPVALDAVLRRALAGDPAGRFRTAGQFAEALEGCRALLEARRRLPPAGRVAGAIVRAPLAAGAALAFAPHLAGSLVASAYIALVLFWQISAAQKAGLLWISGAYIAANCPVVIAAIVALYLPAFRTVRRLAAGELPPAGDVDRARRRLLSLPLGATGLSLAGWLPTLVVLPLGLRWLEAGIDGAQWTHLAVAILLGLLVAATHSYLVMQYAVVRVLWPAAWSDATDFAGAARVELAPVPRRLRWLQVAAGLVPLAGALLLLVGGPDLLPGSDERAFRALTGALVALGVAGLPASIHAATQISKSIAVLTRHSANGPETP
jgi:serine/threonine protein kinase